jgi:3-oxoacyl-[acyl-carrier protein] reductase
MYLSGVGTGPETEVLRQLAGSRVLITGLSARDGVDTARMFADIGTRLVVHTESLSPEVTELAAVLAQSPSDVQLFSEPLAKSDGAIAFARTASQVFGGLDTVINFTRITPDEVGAARTDDAVDTLISAKLAPLAYLTQVIVNRMRTVVSEGLILNVVLMSTPSSARESAIAGLARAALSAMTTSEANAAKDDGVRINAIAPRIFLDGEPSPGACVNNEPDLAALAIYLASRRGKTLSGYVFDAAV